MTINTIKAAQVFAGPGNMAYVAEAEVDNGVEQVYVAVHMYDGENYTVGRESIYESLVGDGDDYPEDFIEEYDDEEEAQESEYAEVFEKLVSVIDVLG